MGKDKIGPAVLVLGNRIISSSGESNLRFSSLNFQGRYTRCSQPPLDRSSFHGYYFQDTQPRYVHIICQFTSHKLFRVTANAILHDIVSKRFQEANYWRNIRDQCGMRNSITCYAPVTIVTVEQFALWNALVSATLMLRVRYIRTVIAHSAIHFSVVCWAIVDLSCVLW